MSGKLKIAVLASGRGSNFEALARSCADPGYPASIVLLIVDAPEAGALKAADRMGIEHLFVDCGTRNGSMSAESSETIYRLCSGRDVGLVCLAGFMRVVKGRLLDGYAGRIMNIHPALLPSFRGLHAQRQAFEYGVRYSGCTVHFVDKGVDTGPIIIQKVVPILRGDTEESLSARILVEEHKAYSEAVRYFAEGRIDIEGRRVSIRDE